MGHPGTAGDAGSHILYVPEARIFHHTPADRATWRYFLSRCWSEGRSKAVVTDLVGRSDGLASERSYVSRVLPRGVIIGMRDALRGDFYGPARSAAIVAGLLATTAGYVQASLSMRAAGRAAAASTA